MFKKITTLLAISLLGLSSVQAEEMAAEKGFTGPEASGYVGVVSNYVWRGVPQNGRLPSVQGGIDLACSLVEGLSFGTWIASIGGDIANETDYYVSYEGSAGDFGYKAGLTMYSYDFAEFTSYDDADGNFVQATTQKEIFVGAGMGDISGTYYMIPAEASTYGAGEKADESIGLSWLELGYETTAGKFDVSATYSTGTYNQEWLNAGNPVESTAILSYSMGKSVSEDTTISFNGTKVLTDSDKGAGLKDEFWMSLDVAY